MILDLMSGIVSSIFYRMGGSNYGTKWRDLGVPTIMIIYFILTGHFHYSLLISFILLFGALTTYFKQKGKNAKWWNWLMCGLAYSIALLPYTIATNHWSGFAIRTIVVTVAITLWSEIQGNAVWEECGRGFIIGSTYFLLT